MYDITIGVLTRWDKILGETFPNETGWDTPYAGDLVRVMNDGRRFTVSGSYEDPAVVQEGAKAPFRNTWLASPPKYPYGRLDAATFDDTMVQTVEDHNAYIVLVVESIDGGGVPAGYENMTRDNNISTDKWTEVRAALITLTDDQDQADSVTSLLDTWWDDPEQSHTPKGLDRLLSTFTSGG